MTSDDRALSWRILFPAESILMELDDQATGQSVGRPVQPCSRESVLVSHGTYWTTSQNASEYAGLVAINSPNLSATTLHHAGFQSIHHFAVLPSLADARWFVPLAAPRTAAAAMRMFPAYRPLARARHRGVQIAARAGLPIWYRDHVWVEQQESSPLERAIGETLGHDGFELAISTGTTGPVRKPTVAVLSRDGRGLAFVKVATSDAARRLLEHEARCVAALATIPQVAEVAPRLLAAGEVDGIYVSMQGALPTQTAGSRFTERHRRLLDMFAAGPLRTPITSPLVRSLPARTRNLSVPGIDIPSLLVRIHAALAQSHLPATVTHGDFTPWNVRRAHGHLTAFDWEYGVIDGLPLLDEMHFRLQTGFLMKSWDEHAAFSMMQELQHSVSRAGMAPRTVAALQAVYHLSNLCQRSEEGHGPDDTLTMLHRALLRRIVSRLDGDTP